MRHTYTARLMSYMHDFLDRLCRDLMRVQDEGDLPRPDDHENDIVRDLRAAAADLRFVEGWLLHLGEVDVEERWEHKLLDLGERLSPRVGEIAVEIEKAVAAVPSE